MRGFRLYIIIGSLLLVIYLVAQFNKPVPTDWTPTLLTKHKIPFGTYIFYNNLGDMIPGAEVSKSSEPIYNTLNVSSYKETTYMIMAPELTIDENDYRELVKFAETGNTVFIAASTLGKVMPKKMKLVFGLNYFQDLTERQQSVNFTNPRLKTQRNYRFDKNIGGQYFSKIDTARAIVLGITGEGNPNYIKYPVKKGAIYLITDPLFFTNYNLLEPFGAEYAGKVMSYLGNHKKIIYDDYYTNGQVSETSILQFFLKNKALKYAYWLAIGAFLMFLFFEVKRRQRIIPVAESFANTSIAFVDVITSLYFNQRDNQSIAEKKIAYFLDYLRTRYFWKVSDTDPDFEKVLQLKTGISENLARSITMQIRYIRNATNIHDDILISLNNLIETFYKESK